MLVVAYILFKHHNIYFFFFNHTAPPDIYTLSLHDALPILLTNPRTRRRLLATMLLEKAWELYFNEERSEEHTSELQSRRDLVCRLLLEKKKYINLIVS